MSSRALRKLQREQDQLRQLQNAQEEEEEEFEEERSPQKLNAFDMLNAPGDDLTASQGEDDDEDGEEKRSGEHETTNTSSEIVQEQQKSQKTKKKRAKKKKAKGAIDPSKQQGNAQEESALDEIDLALKSLSAKSAGLQSQTTAQTLTEANIQLYRLLAIESKHLHSLNEMKRLFGNAVLEHEDDTPAPTRRRGRGPQQVDLGGALSARNSPVARGQGLSGPILRRNFFIQGKEEWPKAAGGGLGMELVEKMDDGTVEYRFTHNSLYQDVQRQFESCVESMDPQRMISMLMFNPYHVSTLLQVSEIAKQQGDHSVSGDLLERALFTFGRSVQSSFTTALTEGKARLDFRRPENRELWLAAWRYMNNLGQKGTWRTAYEWAKLILSLDPEGDPYCVAKVIDQLAIRGGQNAHFLELSDCDFFKEDLWLHQPNIAISSALAQYRQRMPQKCRETLGRSVGKYPWTFARLSQELNLDRIPKAIWGTSPRTAAEELDCESYVHNAKDLWNTPEATSFLVEVADAIAKAEPAPEDRREITVDEARYALLSAVPSIINCIPRALTNQPTSASDPFPPVENLPSYDPSVPSGPAFYAGDRAIEHDFTSDEEERSQVEVETRRTPATDPDETDRAAHDRSLIRRLFGRVVPWVNEPRMAARTDQTNEDGDRDEDTEMPMTRLNGETLRQMLRADPSLARRLGLNEPFEEEHLNNAFEADAPDTEPPSTEQTPAPAAPAGETSTSSNPNGEEPITNPQAYLAGRGLLQLKDLAEKHGLDPSQWPAPTTSPTNSGEAEGARAVLDRYIDLLLTALPSERERVFLLDYRIPQGAGVGVKELIQREIERRGRAGTKATGR